MNTFNQNDYLDQVDIYITLRNLTKSSRENYMAAIRIYFKWLHSSNLTPETATFEDIRRFIMFLKNDQKLANSTINAYIAKIKFLHIYILKKTWSIYEVPTMKLNRKLPEILSRDEANHFIDTCDNLMYKALCALMYGSGLRVSEARHLRYEDVDRKNKSLFIRAPKSRVDRYAILPDSTLDILTNYWHKHGKPKEWLFPGPKHKPIASFTISNNIDLHRKNLNWSKKVSCHMFRHSFATHLYEDGHDLLTIQKLLGHKSLLSTTVYVQLANIQSLSVISPLKVGDRL